MATAGVVLAPFALAVLLAACGGSPTVRPDSPTQAQTGATPSEIQAEGYAIDAKLATDSAYLAYLDSGTASGAVIAKLRPLRMARDAALTAFLDAVNSGHGSATQPQALLDAQAAVAAALALYGIEVTIAPPSATSK
jgi:hypothetical protein